jgi:dTDP-4-amino-4,6-dideoxygalactose transaminase
VKTPQTLAEGWRVPLADVRVDDELRRAVDEVVDSGWWSMGPRVEEFEREFAAFVGVEHAFAVANGTAALHLALLAAGIGPGDEVVLPSLNFVAAANTIAHTGATPVFCDITSADDLNLDPADLEAAVGPRTKAVVILHYGGYPCDVEAVRELAGRRGLIVVEDAAHAPGATWRGEPCGSLGLVGCFSFFSNKNMPLGEGGMVVTDDAHVAEQLRLLRSHGMTTLTWARHRGHASSYDVLLAGFNYRLDELRAAIGLVQLGRLRAENAGRAQISARYREALHGTGGVTIPFGEVEDATTPAHHLAVALMPEGRRDDVRAALSENRIQTSVHYPPIHSFTAFRELSRRPLPRTDSLAERILTLPLFPHLDDEQVELVSEGLVTAVRASRPRSRAAG